MLDSVFSIKHSVIQKIYRIATPTEEYRAMATGTYKNLVKIGLLDLNLRQWTDRKTNRQIGILVTILCAILIGKVITTVI